MNEKIDRKQMLEGEVRVAFKISEQIQMPVSLDRAHDSVVKSVLCELNRRERTYNGKVHISWEYNRITVFKIEYVK